MTTQQALIEEIKKAPDPIVMEVYTFLQFLREKTDDEPFHGLALSESSLTKDWLSEEENKAWENL